MATQATAYQRGRKQDQRRSDITPSETHLDFLVKRPRRVLGGQRETVGQTWEQEEEEREGTVR